ncbi:MAG: hypothetical protein ACI8WB_000702 [Phenylobacterium sp.]|jgi:hypothetical protein
MSITESLVAATLATNNLTHQVADKISLIDQQVANIRAAADAKVAQAVSQVPRASIGGYQQPYDSIIVTSEDDAGLKVKEAFAAGAKHIQVHWEADGLERHWNTLVTMPIGATLSIAGPNCIVDTLGGAARTDRACYALGNYNGTSEHGSPMIFKNTQPSPDDAYPFAFYARVRDFTDLISMTGNNTIIFGGGTYLHDQGGMLAYADGGGLITVSGNSMDTPNCITGGSGQTQFYLSGALVNNMGGTSVCEIRFRAGTFQKVSSDGPVLQADKGFRRLLNKGVAGITAETLSKQPCDITEAEAGLNDDAAIGMTWGYYNLLRGVDAEANLPRMVGAKKWAYVGGWTLAQFSANTGGVSMHGLSPVEGTNMLMGAR